MEATVKANWFELHKNDFFLKDWLGIWTILSKSFKLADDTTCLFLISSSISGSIFVLASDFLMFERWFQLTEFL